jgi:hypothetical protein
MCRKEKEFNAAKSPQATMMAISTIENLDGRGSGLVAHCNGQGCSFVEISGNNGELLM